MPIERMKTKKVSMEDVPPKIVKVSEELSCKLTDVEWKARAEELAQAHQETERQKERKKAIAAEISADVKAAEAKKTKLSNIVATSQEQRQVTVEVKYDYAAGVVTRTRTNTNELLSSREITDDERQAKLEFVDADQIIESRHED